MREKRQLTQSEVSKILKITREAYSMYESDKRQMSYQSLCILADFYNVTVDYLLGRKENNFALSEVERDIIFKYSYLDCRGQEAVQNMIDYEYNVQSKRAGEIAEDRHRQQRYDMQHAEIIRLEHQIYEAKRKLEEIRRRIAQETNQI